MSHVQKAISGRQLHIPLNAKIDRNKLLVQVYDSEGSHIKDAEIEEKGFGEYVIKYKPKEAGSYRMDILVSGDLKRTVTIIADPAPVARLLGAPRLATYVGQEVEFEIECPAGIKVEQIEGRFYRVYEEEQSEDDDDNEEFIGETIIKSISETKFLLQFRPIKPGLYSANVGILGQGPMAGELTVEALELPSITLLLSDSTSVVGVPYVWRLKHHNVPVKQLQVHVTNPDGTVANASIVDNMDGTLDVVYTPTIPGTHTAKLRLDSGEFSNQLQMNATHYIPEPINDENSRRIDTPVSLTTSRSGEPTITPNLPAPILKKVRYHKELTVGGNFELNLKILNLRENNLLAVIVRDEKGETVYQKNPTQNPKSKNGFDFSWQVTMCGKFSAHIYLDNKPLGTSIPFTVVDMPPRRAEFPGNENIISGKVGSLFTLNLTLDSTENKIEAPIKDETGAPVDNAQVELISNTNGKGGVLYKLTYLPTKAGEYTLSIIMNDKPVDNSAAIFRVFE